MLHESERRERRHHILTVAVTFPHVAIATISIIMQGRRWPWRCAIALGLIGSLGAAYAFL
jgi:hypothetical protein